MPEGMNVEVAHKLSEGGEPVESDERRHWTEFAEILEVIVLALVAIATAWSGYQAARWDGRQAYLYGTASRMRIEADEALTLGGQQKLLDVTTFNTWIEAQRSGDEQLAALYVRRFSPEFKVAFDAWVATDPAHNPDAPPGPSFMPEYVNPGTEKGQALNDRGLRDVRRRAPRRARTRIGTCVRRCCSRRCCSSWRSRSASSTGPCA